MATTRGNDITLTLSTGQPDDGMLNQNEVNIKQACNSLAIATNLEEAVRREMIILRGVSHFPELLSSTTWTLNQAIARYISCWIPLLIKYPDQQLIPPLDVDWIWLVHSLDPVKFAKDASSLFKVAPEAISRKTFNQASFVAVPRRQSRSQPQNDDGEELIPVAPVAVHNPLELFSSTGAEVQQTKLLWHTEFPEQPYDQLSGTKSFMKINQSWSQLVTELLGHVHRQRDFLPNIQPWWYDNEQFISNAIQRYKQFLYLIQQQPNHFTTPTYDIDLVWHAHQMYHSAYTSDCVAIMGKLLGHDDKDQDRSLGSKLANGWSSTKSRWYKLYREPQARAGTGYRADSCKSANALRSVQLKSCSELEHEISYEFVERRMKQVNLNNEYAPIADVAPNVREILVTVALNQDYVKEVVRLQGYLHCEISLTFNPEESVGVKVKKVLWNGSTHKVSKEVSKDSPFVVAQVPFILEPGLPVPVSASVTVMKSNPSTFSGVLCGGSLTAVPQLEILTDLSDLTKTLAKDFAFPDRAGVVHVSCSPPQRRSMHVLLLDKIKTHSKKPERDREAMKARFRAERNVVTTAAEKVLNIQLLATSKRSQKYYNAHERMMDFVISDHNYMVHGAYLEESSISLSLHNRDKTLKADVKLGASYPRRTENFEVNGDDSEVFPSLLHAKLQLRKGRLLEFSEPYSPALKSQQRFIYTLLRFGGNTCNRSGEALALIELHRGRVMVRSPFEDIRVFVVALCQGMMLLSSNKAWEKDLVVKGDPTALECISETKGSGKHDDYADATMLAACSTPLIFGSGGCGNLLRKQYFGSECYSVNASTACGGRCGTSCGGGCGGGCGPDNSGGGGCGIGGAGQ